LSRQSYTDTTHVGDMMENSIYDESRGWNVDENANRESFDEVRDSAVSILSSQDREEAPFRAVRDSFKI